MEKWKISCYQKENHSRIIVECSTSLQSVEFFHKESICHLRRLFVNPTTVAKVLKKNGIRNYVACSKQFLSLQNQIKRLKFAIKHQHWTTEWQDVYFLDEKTVQSYSNGRVLVKRKVNERYNVDKITSQETQNTNNKVNLVGLVSFAGPNMLYSVSANLNGEKFQYLMKKKVRHIVEGYTVLMDNATIHTLGKEYLESIGIHVLDFSPKSNDLNVIENVWAELQKILNRKLRTITISTKAELLRLIEESWKEIPVSFIRNCILSMDRRIKEVIKVRGKQTKY